MAPPRRARWLCPGPTKRTSSRTQLLVPIAAVHAIGAPAHLKAAEYTAWKNSKPAPQQQYNASRLSTFYDVTFQQEGELGLKVKAKARAADGLLEISGVSKKADPAIVTAVRTGSRFVSIHGEAVRDDEHPARQDANVGSAAGHAAECRCGPNYRTTSHTHNTPACLNMYGCYDILFFVFGVTYFFFLPRRDFPFCSFLPFSTGASFSRLDFRPL